MPHLVNAAKQLRQQITDLFPNAKVEVLDDVDGLGFQRSIRVTPAAGKKVKAALEIIDDRRISRIVSSSYGVRITFVPDTRADWRTPFPLAEVLAVLESE